MPASKKPTNSDKANFFDGLNYQQIDGCKTPAGVISGFDVSKT